MNIHVSQNGKEMGPYSVDEVNTMLNVGSLHPDDMAWHDGAGRGEAGQGEASGGRST